MSSVIAIVKSIVGQVYAMSPEGFQRLIVEGDRLFKGDQLLTGNEGMATLELTDGRTVDLGRDSRWSDTDAVAAADAPPAQLAIQTPADDVAQLQKAIEAGADPTKELEATAAGPGAGGASGSGGAGGGHSFVMLDATAANVDPTIGFATDTAPLTTEALDEEEALPLDAAQPQDSLPSETVPVPDGPNSSPQGQGASITTDEDTPVQGQLSANDPDGDTLTYSLDSGPRNGTLVVNPDGSYTYTPNGDFNGSDSFTAIVDDGKGGTDTITVTIGVNPVNDAPAAANDGPVSATEDTPASGNVLSNDSDADGDSLTVTQFNVGGSIYQAGQTAVINGVGSLVINANGSYTFTPAANYTGTVPTATYTVSDGSLTDTGELSFADVSPVNDAPAAANDGPVAVTEDTPASGNVLANDTDADGDSLTVTEFIFGGSTYQAGQTAVINGVGSLVINANGSYTFTPAANYTGTVPTATYTVSDGSLTDTAELSFGNVAPVNDAPETAVALGSGNEDAAGIPVALSGSDIDGSVANFVIKSLPANGALLLNGVALAIGDSVPATGNGATVTFVPAANWNGTTSFDYTSVDNQGVEDSSPATGTITVASVNDAPETAAASGSGNEDAPGIPVALSGSDIDGSVANFVIKSLPANGTLLLNGVALNIGDSVPATGNGATVTFVPNANWNGTTSFQYASVDNQGLEDSSPATGTITVASVNDAPETAAALGSGNEDNPISVNLSGSDSDGAIDHFVIKALPANGTLLLNGVALAIGDSVPASGNGATVTFVPNANWNGTTSFDYASVDNQGVEDSSPATGTITVASVNNAPETAAASGAGNEDAPGIPVALSGSDLDGTVDHFVIKSLPTDGTLLLNGVALAIGAVVPATANGASITFVPNANWNGTTTFQYASVDNQGLEDSTPATGTITMTSVNDAPETTAASGSGNEDSAGVPVALSGSDLDGSVDYFVIKALPANGALLLNGLALAIGDSVPATGNGATVTFVPAANWNGTTSFDYTSVDNQGVEDSSPATGTITVASVNDAPETAAASGSGNEDAPGIPVALSGSDIDGSVANFVIKSLPANGTLLLNGVALAIGDSVPATDNGATVNFVPNANWNGTTTFQYASVDNQGLEDGSPATGTITVASVNDAPETAAALGSGNEDNPISVNLSGSDSDGAIDHFVIKALPANGTLLLNGVALAIGDSVPASGNGATVTFVPNANWNGTTSFDYASVDNQGLEDSSASTGTITVASVNDAPETSSASASGNEDAAGIPVALSGSDLDGTVDHFVIKALPANGTLLLNGVALNIGDSVPASGNGATVTFVPNANWNGTTTFDYASVDNQGLEDSSPATGTITVASVNDAPETAAASGSGNEDSAGIPVALSGSDLDGSVDHFVIKSLPANGTLLLNGVALTIGSEVPASANGASITFVPAANWNGSTSFQYASVDNQGLEDSSPATGAITVNTVNDAPETTAASASGNEDAPDIPVALSGSDIDGTVDHFVIKSLPANGTLLLNGVVLTTGDSVPASGNGAAVTFVPAANWNGSTSFQYASVDNQGLEDSSPATGTITVASVNNAPETAAASGAGNEDAPGIPVALSGSDLDGTVDHFVIKSLPANGTLLLNGVALNVGDSVPATGNGAAVTFVPAANWNGTTSFDYTSVDNQGLEDSTPATGTITVASVNDAPETAAASGSGNEDSAGIPVALAGSDVDGSVANFVIKSLPANGTLLLNGVALAIGDSVPASGNGAAITFVPNANWNGTTTFQYASVDNQGLEDSSPATGTITVASVNDAPETAATSGSGNEDSAGTPVALSGSDLDGTVDHFIIKSLPANGTLLLNGVALAIGSEVPASANGASITFVPNANWNGTTTFQYASVDNQGLEDSSPATGTITVVSANDAPVAMDSNASTEENTVLQSAVPAASDTDGTISSYALVSGPGAGNGTLTFNGNGSYTFNPGSDFDHLAAGESRTLNFTYTATDNDGATSAPATITITVTGTNDGPVFAAVNLTANVSEEGLVNGLPDTTGSPTDVSNALVASGTFAISDVDSQSLSVTLTAPTTNLTSNGIPLTWSGSGTSMLSASAGSNPIMTVSITSTGAYLVTLLGQVDHLQANAEDVLNFSVGVTASDGLTSISSALQVRIEDDAPLLATPMQAILLDSSGATAIGDLNLSTGADINGASVQFSTTTGVSVDASGNILSTTLNKDGSVSSSSSYITYQGSKLHYVAGANSLTAVSADGTEVFKITADPASGQYQITNFVSLDSPSSTFTSFDLSGGNSGSYDLGTGSRFSLQATATSNGVADTVNTSNNSFGVGSSQSIDTGDLLSFTFIDKSTNQATDLTAISVTTDKLGTGENLTWTAFDIAGNAVGSGTVNGVSGGTTSFTIDDSKLNSGEYEFSTIRFGAGASTSYKLLISSITGQTEAYDQRISLGVKATDGDGDTTTTQSLQITFDSDDTIQAGSNDSALGGGNGANNLLGGVGDDILTGGKGSDTLTGGSGADSFVWKAGDAGSAGSPDQDVVKDFNTSQDDRLNLSDLLQGETTSTIDNFLKLIVDSGTGNATLLVSKDGHLNDGGSAASHADLSITLEGAAAQLSGSSINSLIAGADPTIKVDHS